MSIYRTAMGKNVDMSSLASRNEKVRAVGNMNVNARGDTIDAQGRVIKPITEKVNAAYAKTVGNRSSHVIRKSQESLQPDILKVADLTKEELELEESFADDLEVEQIKAMETKKK
jgi:hypothetical protein